MPLGYGERGRGVVGSVDGGSIDGGSVDGGSVDGGSVDGGSVDGDSLAAAGIAGTSGDGLGCADAAEPIATEAATEMVHRFMVTQNNDVHSRSESLERGS
jgi:hypothetical protein